MKNQRRDLDSSETHKTIEIANTILDSIDASLETQKLTREVITIVEKTLWVVGKPPSTVAATAVYVASQATNDPLTQLDIAECADVTAGTISHHKNDLLEHYLDISEQPTPLLQDLDQDSL